MYDILELNKKLVSDLREIAKGLQIKKVESFSKKCGNEVYCRVENSKIYSKWK